MKKRVLVPIVGIHSAGKSTIRSKLNFLGYVTEEECAELLRVNENITAGAGADVSFEDLVQDAEKKRDTIRNWNTKITIVESWHILTLAYMLTRGKSFISMENYIEYVRNQSKLYDIYCIFLKSDPNKILERSRKLHSEEDIDQYYGFYQNLEDNISIVIELLGFHYQEFNTMKSLDETVNEVSSFLLKIKEAYTA